MKVYSHRYISDSLQKGQVESSSYDLVSYFKLLTQNDQSCFVSDDQTNLNTRDMDLAEKMEHCMKMQSG